MPAGVRETPGAALKEWVEFRGYLRHVLEHLVVSLLVEEDHAVQLLVGLGL